MAAFDQFDKILADTVIAAIGPVGAARLAALNAARSTMPDADVYDRIRLARYILTGSEEAPEVERVMNSAGETVAVYVGDTSEIRHVERYPHPSGDTLVLGPEIFVGQNEDGDDVICWQGVNFVRQSEPMTGVVGPDPAFGPADEEQDDEIDREREPAPSAGTRWAGRRGRQPD